MLNKVSIEDIISKKDFFFIEENKKYIITGQVIENELVKYNVYDKENKSIVGNIYRARLIDKIPSLSAFFVDIGSNKKGFYQPKISKFKSLKESDELLLQVSYDGNESKGPKLIDSYELKGNSIILTPFDSYLKFSKKIDNNDFKLKVKKILQKYKEYGFIIRTNAQFISLDEIEKEVVELIEKHKIIQKEINFSPTPKLIFENNNFEKILNKISCPIITNVLALSKKYKEKDIYYKEDFSIKNYEKIYEQIKELFKRKVVLENGIEFIFDKTEAFNVIDINSKGFLNQSKYNLDRDINKSCYKELIKHVHLRNMYGIILIDFISYNDKNIENELLELIKSEAIKYENPFNIVGFTKLGILETTRNKRVSSLPLNELNINFI